MNAEDAVALAEQTELVAACDFMGNPHLNLKPNGQPNPPSIPAIRWWLDHPDLGLSHVRYNALEGVIDAELLPWNDEPHSWTDADTSYLLADLQRRTNGLVKNEGHVLHALNTLAHDRRYDPLMDMLDGLPAWDGTPRADTLIIDFLGASDTPYTRAVTRHMLNGAVMRGFIPGCKFESVITLSSKRQGIGKSTFVRKLALNDDFFTDSLGSIVTKEASETIQGKWLIEIGELEGLRKREVETVKLFLSRQEDRYRAAFGRFAETRKRRCIFIATTNSTAFLTDRTGNRRFLPIACDVQPPKLDIFAKGAREHIAQAWAEVLHDYRERGSLPLVLPAEIQAQAGREAESFTVADSKDGLIAAWVDELRPGEKVCVLQVMDNVFGIDRTEASKHTCKAMQNEIAQILDLHPKLHRMDGKPKHSAKYGQQRCWEFRP